MKEDPSSLFWSLSQIGSGLEALARRSGLQPSPVQVPHPPNSIALDDAAASRDALNQWIESAATWLGLEAEPAAVPYQGLELLIKDAGPAVLQVPGSGPPRFLFLLPRNLGRRHRGCVAVLAPDLRTVPLKLEVLRTLLCGTLEEKAAPEIDGLLDEAGIAGARRGTAKAALLLEGLRTKDVGGCWMLRQSPGTSFRGQANRIHLPRRLGAPLVAHGAEYVLLIVSRDIWTMAGYSPGR
jgi:hypothetical protein